jgi:hypothetical protein
MHERVSEKNDHESRIATFEVGKDTVFYDRENYDAWIESDYTVPIGKG